MNEFEVRRFLDIIHPPEELFEIRIIDGKRTYSGYFTDSLKAYNAIKEFQTGNIYVVFNKINPACYGRQQRDTIVQLPKSTTSDKDVTDRNWVLIDIDPVRPSDCNSSAQELMAAKTVCGMVYKHLRNIGFAEPVFGMSGNGYHMLYRVNMPNNGDTLKLIKDFLNGLSLLFSTDIVGIDTTVHSPAQLTKLLGTVSRKGTDKDDTRPQRESQIMHIPDNLFYTPQELFQKVADIIPKAEMPTYHNNYGKDAFNIDDFIRSTGIQVAKDVTTNGARKIVLENCPFDSSHKAPDSALFIMGNGAIGFKCLHNSCSGHTWKDLRALLDPEYANRGNRPYNNLTRTIRPLNHSVIPSPDDIIPEDKEKGAKFLQLSDIKNIDRSQIVTIPTGVIELDKSIIGLNKGEVSLISGSNASGKSTFINQICLNAIEKGFKASIWSGELTPQRMKNWIHLQAAGRQYTKQSDFSSNSYYVPNSTGAKIDHWMKEKLYLYNNDYGNKFTQLLSDMAEHVKEQSIDLIILDNLMALDILMLEGSQNQQQAKMIVELTNFAKRSNVHLILVAHPRKSTTFLRKTDISGTADLTNAVDNVFIVHRVNNDFIRAAGEFYGTAKASEYYTFSNVIEICKNRDLGIMDALIGLFFEIESKRFLNERYENVVYSWNENEQKDIDYNRIYSGFNGFAPNKDFEKEVTNFNNGFEPINEGEPF
jgi:archaellum biogenesis ATPase FlaH